MTYSPWSELARLGDIIVGYVPLPDGLGWWEPDERVILLDNRLGRVERRCTLAHELEHAIADDYACHGTADDSYFTTRMERRASSRAARKLITVSALADAIAAYDDDDHLVAAQLDVDIATLDIRRMTLSVEERRWLRRRLGAAEGEEGMA